MAEMPLNAVLQHIRRLLGTGADADEDGPLLARFILDREEAAFAALLARHGPMVLSICQRILSNEQDAEDAFQAVFLVLSRKASSVRRHQSLAGWLCRVAYRVALQARAKSRRSPSVDIQVLDMFPSSPDTDQADLHSVLYQELNGLPDRYHAPLVLCYLEGKTYEEAARTLKWPLGTFKKRMAQAREMLRGRLDRKGVAALSSASLAVLLGEQTARAALPTSLLGATLKTVMAGSAGSAAVGAASVKAFALADQFLQVMFLTKVKIMTAAVVSLVCALAGATVVLTNALAEKPTAPPAARADAGIPPEKAGPFRLLTELTPEKHYAGVPLPVGFSPDGKRLAVRVHGAEQDQVILQDVASGEKLASLTLDEGARSVVAMESSLAIVYAHDDTSECSLDLRDWKTLARLREIKDLKLELSPIEAFQAGDALMLVGPSREEQGAQPGIPNIGGIGGGAGFPGIGGGIAFAPLINFGGDLKIGCLQDLTGKQTLTTHTPENAAAIHSISCARSANNIQAFLVTNEDEESALKLYDLSTKKTTVLEAKMASPLSQVVSRDGRSWAVQTSENTIQLWDVAQRRRGHVLRDGEETIACQAFTPDGQTLVTASSDGTVKCWDVATGKVRQKLSHPHTQQLSFSRDGLLLSTASAAGVKVWTLQK